MAYTANNKILHPLQRIFGADFNPILLGIIIRQSLVWCILFIIISVISSFLYLRYTQEVFQTEATIMLKSVNTAKVLDIKGAGVLEQNKKAASKAKALLGSELILSRVIDSLPLKIAYFMVGEIKDNELYKHHPFVVELQYIDKRLKDLRFNIIFVDKSHFKISYTINDEEVIINSKLYEQINTPLFKAKIVLSPYFTSINQADLSHNEFYFIVFNKRTILSRLMKNVRAFIGDQYAKIIKIQVGNTDQLKAADIANTIAKCFLEFDREKQIESSNKIISFIDDQLLDINLKMEHVENELNSFKRVKKFINPSVEEANVLKHLEDIDKTKAELILEQKSLDWLSRNIDSGKVDPLFSMNLPGINENRFKEYSNELNDLINMKRKTLLKVTPDNPKIGILDTQINRIKNSMRESVAAAQMVLDFKQSVLDKKIHKYENVFDNLPDEEAEFYRIKRLQTINEKFYMLLLDKKAEFSISKEGYVSGNIILKPAVIPLHPIFPNRLFVNIAGIFGGIFLGLSLIIIRYLLHHNILFVSDIERISRAGILGVIPHYDGQKDFSHLVINRNPKSIITEAFRSIRSNLQFISNVPGPKSIAITSSISSEGKTFVALNLASIITMTSKKVIVLDLDMRKPKVHKAFDMQNVRGMSTILIGKDTIDECINATSFENLEYISSGPIPPNPSELIVSDKFDEVLAYLRKKYDYIIMDTPPIGIVADAIDIIKKVDYPIFTLRADYSKRNFIGTPNRLVKENKIKNLSIVLNDVGRSSTSYGYGYNYGYGYGYGYGRSYGYGYYDEDDSTKESFVQRIINKLLKF